MAKRKVEVFTSGCYLCEETVKLVKEITCSSCELSIHDLSKKEGVDKAKSYGVTSVPTVVVDGKIVECCKRGKPDRNMLEAAGIGKSA